MKPPFKTLWLLAAVMAVVWAIATNVLGSILLLAFGRGGSPVRYWGMLIIEAVVVAFLCAYSYREGWDDGRDDRKNSQIGKPKGRFAA